MRREHASILTDVLDGLNRHLKEAPAAFHITQVAAQANLPHDRLMAYMAELADAGLLDRQRPPRPTAKGVLFLQCYHEWLRVQARFGLLPGNGATKVPPVPMIPSSAARELQVAVAQAAAGHDRR